MSKKPIEYNDDAIQVLEGLEAVRKRPGMYIGSTDSRGLHHLVYEIVDNSVDEALAGHGDNIIVTIHKDNSISVTDKGRGMPTGMHKMGKPTPEVILTVLHAGGKFGQGGYKTSGGLHGVGASVVNALSEWLVVTIKRDGYVYEQRFENGGKPVTTLEKTGTTRQTGTTIHFKPDKSIFSTTVYNYETLCERLRESAFLLKGLKIELNDLRHDQKEVFHYESGIEAFVAYLNEEKDSLHPVVFFEGIQNGIPIPKGKEYLVNLIDKEIIERDVAHAKKHSDVVVVSMHWGVEYILYPNKEQEELAKFLAAIGVDIVIGHHPHVLQPMEFIERPDGERMFVIYSLGNFLSGQKWDYKDIGGVVQLRVKKTVGSGESKSKLDITVDDFIPTFVSQEAHSKFHVVPLKDAASFGLPNAKAKTEEMMNHMYQWLNNPRH